MFGGSGNDLLVFDAYDGNLYGGEGADIFKFTGATRTADPLSGAYATIKDFSIAEADSLRVNVAARADLALSYDFDAGETYIKLAANSHIIASLLGDFTDPNSDPTSFTNLFGRIFNADGNSLI